MTVKFQEGARVRITKEPDDVGTVDESWVNGPQVFVSVVWDRTGCMSVLPATALTLIEQPERCAEQ